jgi:hypothetical protein
MALYNIVGTPNFITTKHTHFEPIYESNTYLGYLNMFFMIIINYYIYLYLHLPPQIKKLIRLICNANFHDINMHIYPSLVINGGNIEFTFTKMKLVHNTST